MCNMLKYVASWDMLGQVEGAVRVLLGRVRSDKKKEWYDMFAPVHQWDSLAVGIRARHGSYWAGSCWIGEGREMSCLLQFLGCYNLWQRGEEGAVLAGGSCDSGDHRPRERFGGISGLLPG